MLILSFSTFLAHASSDVMVHLFEWKWKDIALECENVLGPKGFKKIQVSPPQENAVYPGNPWFERYQPVSFDIISRSGNEAEFKDMIKRCEAVGVSIVVDAVINHMASTPHDSRFEVGTRFTGGSYTRYNFEGLFGPSDFNYCRGNPEVRNDIWDWNDRTQVLYCELVSLPDLNTEKEYVRAKLAGFLGKLMDFGVAGFRIDAAKHMPPDDLHNILSRLKKTPYVYSEVIDGGDSPVRNYEYERFGEVSEFRYGQRLSEIFRNGKLSWLQSFGEVWGFMSTTKALVFIDNHDTQRSEGVMLSFRSPVQYKLANVFMLGWPYGSPNVMSSFRFKNHADTPPVGSGCGNGWVCEHRWPEIAAMVQFRKITDGEYVSNWWSNGENQIAFGRGSKGFVVINNENRPLDQYIQTALPKGKYCNILVEDKDFSSCMKGADDTNSIMVSDGGWVHFRLPNMKALALHSKSLTKN